MFKFRLMTRLALAASIAMVVSGPIAVSSAQEAAPTVTPTANQIPIVIGIIDVTRVEMTSSAGVSLKKQLDQKRKQFETEIQASEKQQRAEYDKLNKSRASLSEEQFKKSVQDFQKKQNDLRKEFSARSKAIDTAHSTARKTIRNAINTAMIAVAEKRGLTLILDKKSVPLSAQAWDITSAILAELNKALPSVKM